MSQCVSAPKTLNIDHHISNTEYADYLYLDTAAAATGEIMYELIDTLGVEVDRSMMPAAKQGFSCGREAWQ